jgi:S1-C subfamily serine protease
MAGSMDAMSDQLADAVEAAAPAVVQVHGRRRPASGLVYERDVIVTAARNLGREDGLVVRGPAGTRHEAQLAGWDPGTGIAVLRTDGLVAEPISVSERLARVGHLVLAVGRSWSNNVAASAGLVSVVGGPLPTGRRRAIDEVIRTTAPMHDGFTGGALLDTSGRLLGIVTGITIRGTAVVIPARIVWSTAASVLEKGRPQRGYLGLAGQSVQLPEGQRAAGDPDLALLVAAVVPGGPASAAGLLVGDLLISFDSHAVGGPEDLLELLTGERVGRDVPVRLQRGGRSLELMVRVGERADR